MKMELLFFPIITIAVLLILPFIAIPHFIELSDKAKEYERLNNLKKTEFKQELMQTKN